MKKFILAFALLIGASSFYNTVEAQSINISINIGRQPAWGPVGYDYVGYYYFPDIDCYYDVNLGMFYYMNRGRWISARYLPYAYRHYDLYSIHKVVLNVRDPWRYHRTHYRDYGHYKGHRSQIVIRDSRDIRYRDSRNNRVAWHSDNRKANQRKEYNSNNNNGRNKNYSDNRYDNSRDNNNRTNRNKSDNRKEYNSSDKDKNNNRSNKVRSNTNSSQASPAKDKAKTKTNSRENRKTTQKSGEYRLASNTERATGRNR